MDTIRWSVGLAVMVPVLVWAVHSGRRAWLDQREPADDAVSYLRHHRAAGSLAIAVGVVLAFALNLIPDMAGALVWVAAIAAIVVLVICERRWPVARGSVRSAALAPRDPGSLVSRPLSAVAGMGVLAAIAVVAGCWMLGDSPGGRTITTQLVQPDGSGPAQVVSVDGFPGWPVGLVAGVGLAAMLAAAVAAWRVVVDRPALLGVDPDIDAAFRRSTTDRLIRIVSIAAWSMAAGVYQAARNAFEDLHRVSDPAAGFPTYFPGVILLSAAGLAVVISFLAAPTRARLGRAVGGVAQVEPL